MSVENYTQLGAAAIASSVRAGETSPVEMIKASFKRAADIGAGADELNIFLYDDEKASVAEAEEMQTRIEAATDIGILAGVPIAIKDNIASLGLPTTCASKILRGYVSPFEAAAVTRRAEETSLGDRNRHANGFSAGDTGILVHRDPPQITGTA